MIGFDAILCEIVAVFREMGMTLCEEGYVKLLCKAVMSTRYVYSLCLLVMYTRYVMLLCLLVMYNRYVNLDPAS